MRQTGIANLPLHGGKAPAWLFQRMVRLGREIVRLIVEDQGPRELLVRISDPYWFQSLGFFASRVRVERTEKENALKRLGTLWTE
jgi:hypothetical protein